MIPQGFPTNFIFTYVLDQLLCAGANPRRAAAGTTAQARQLMVTPRLYHTEWYIFAYPPLLELNPIILVQYSVRMSKGLPRHMLGLAPMKEILLF